MVCLSNTVARTGSLGWIILAAFLLPYQHYHLRSVNCFLNSLSYTHIQCPSWHPEEWHFFNIGLSVRKKSASITECLSGTSVVLTWRSWIQLPKQSNKSWGAPSPPPLSFPDTISQEHHADEVSLYIKHGCSQQLWNMKELKSAVPVTAATYKILLS